MRALSATGCALALSAMGVAQIAVREDATRAHLVDGKTTISLALRNNGSKPLESIVLLQWFGAKGDQHNYARRVLQIQPGDLFVEIPLPLWPKHDPLFERLEYDVTPASHDYTAFIPQKGVLSLPNIADYAFTLSVVSTVLPRPGTPYEIRVLTNHPVTGQPVSDVRVSSEEATAVSGKEGVAILRVVRKQEEDEDGWEDEVTARLGDFEQASQTTPLRFYPEDLRIYTDKPLYQPGQTMHVRFLAIGADGRALSGKEHEIRIANKDDEVEHSTTVTTSRFGIASTDWEIPDNAKSGEYRIEVRREGIDSFFSASATVRRYELPSFRVAAKPDRAWYSMKDRATIEVRAEYLFGKPLAAGTARIIEDDEEKPLAEGKLDANGSFRGTIAEVAEIGDSVKFVDRHFTAFVTDATTNRTEQRKFDLRVSRDPLHLYAARHEFTATGQRLYVSVFTPDGAPARSDVEVVDKHRVLGTGHTNRYGMVRIDVANDHDELLLRAKSAGGEIVEESVPFYDKRGLWLETDHTLYRAGQSVRCRFGGAEADSAALLFAWNERGETVFSRSVRLGNGRAEIEIPYSANFGRVLSIGAVAGGVEFTAAKAVIFPGRDELVVRATASSPEYRPGQTATLLFHSSNEAALGIAIVDQSVFERASTDREFHRANWFGDSWSRSEANIAGITERDLVGLDTGRIDDDLQTVAATLVRTPTLINNAGDYAAGVRDAFLNHARQTLEPVQKALDDHYLRTLESPRDLPTLFTILGGRDANILDPWLQPYRPQFSSEGADEVIRFVSAGPDKSVGTDDDFTALEIRRRWFAKFEAIIRETLQRNPDYPGTEDEFVRMLDGAGIRFAALRDPWGGSLKIIIRYARTERHIQIFSAGPDGAFGTGDDLAVADFSGRYFATTAAKIQQALDAAGQFPRTQEELDSTLAAYGIDFSALRDPWGRSYHAVFRVAENYGDDVEIYSYSQYQGAIEQRRRITPVKRTELVVEIRSAGKDGVRGSYDDFIVASFRML